MREFNWNEYPGMPERFRSKIEWEVMRQCTSKRRGSRRTKRTRRIVCIALIVCLVCGATVYAAGFKLQSLLGTADDSALEIIRRDVPIKSVEESQPPENENAAESSAAAVPPKAGVPLLRIDEVLYDGTGIYIYASATEEGENYDLAADGIVIAGENYGLIGDCTAENEYYFYADLSDAGLTEDFEVTLPLSVYGKHSLFGSKFNIIDGVHYQYHGPTTRFDNQEIRFMVQASGSVKAIEPGPVEGEGWRVGGLSVKLAPTVTAVSYTLYFTGGNAQERAEEYVSPAPPYLSLDNGTEALNSMEDRPTLAEGTSISPPHEQEDGSWAVEVKYNLRPFHSKTQTLTIVPCKYKMDSEDKPVPGKAQAMDEYAFTVDCTQ